jgi:hypothetical protein
MPDFNISIFPGAAGAVADASVLAEVDASVLAEVSATPASAETVLARSLSALLERRIRRQVRSPGVGQLPISPGHGRRRPPPVSPSGNGTAPPSSAERQTPAARGEEHGDPP